jgi:uncharacterized protein
MYYLDTSAAVKLIVDEPEAQAFRAWFAQASPCVSSDLMRTELLRATRRASLRFVPRARKVLDALALLRLPSSCFEAAALLEPIGLRSLDTLHLACALSLGDDLHGFVTYDERQAEAARQAGIRVFSP